MGKPENRSRLEPTMLRENHEPGGHDDSHKNQSAICPRGVLSGIILGGWESQPHGEGPDGSTQLAKETYAGHAGSDHHKQTSLQGITIRAKKSFGATVSTTEEPDARKPHVRVCAGGFW